MTRPAPLGDQADRDRATLDLDHPCAVVAAAGTGKTETLARRVAAAIADGRVTMPQVAAITFTRKAAGELQQRLRSRLSRAATDEPDLDRRRRLLRAIHEVELAAISTIHAFAEGLLRSEPFAAGVDPAFRVLEESEARRLREEVWDRFEAGPGARLLQRATAFQIHELRRSPNKTGGPLLLARTPWRIDDLREAATRSVSPLIEVDLHRPSPPEAALTPLRATAEHLRDDADDILDTTDGFAKETDKLISGLRAARATFHGAATNPDPSAALASFLSANVPGSISENARPPGAKGNWKDLGLLEETRDRTRDLFESWRSAVTDLAPTAAAALDAEPWRLLAEILDGYRAAWRQTLDDHAVLDFDGLLQRALHLAKSSDAAARLRERFRLVLVDECQDVDPAQLRLALALTGTFDEHDHWHPDGGRLLFVGDPKQSIFAFRGADLDLYDDAVTSVTADKPEAHLTSCFRCRPAICRAVNAAFAPDMTGAEHQADYVPLEATRPDAGPALIGLQIPPTEKKRTATAARTSEAVAVAAFLRQLADGALPWPVEVEDRHAGGGSTRPARLGDVLILLRAYGASRADALSQVQTYERALEKAGVAHVTIDGKEFFGRAEVAWAHALLRALDEPDDAVALAATLRGPAAAVPDRALLEWRLAGGRLHLDAPPPPELPADHPVAEAFERLRTLRPLARDRARSLRARVEATLFASGLPEVLATEGDGETRLANLLKVAELASTAQAEGTTTLRGFVRFLADRMEGRTEERELPLLDPESTDAVRIMTVHKAKGLDSPIVILAGWSGAADRTSREVLLRRGPTWTLRAGPLRPPGWDAAEDDHRAREAAQETRIGYVAATRARDWLITTVPPDEDQPAGAFASLRRVFRPATPGEDLATPDRPCDDLEVLRWAVTDQLAQPVRTPAAQAAELWTLDRWQTWISAAEAAGSSGPTFPRAKADAATLTGIPEIDVEIAVPPPGLATRPIPRDHRTGRRGELVHRLFERIDLQRLNDLDDPIEAARRLAATRRKMAETLVRAQGWEADEADHLLDLLVRLLATEPVRRAGGANTARHEVRFTWRQDPAGNSQQLIEGAIDLAYRSAPLAWHVVDIKTARSSLPARAGWVAQVRAYAAAAWVVTASSPAVSASVSTVAAAEQQHPSTNSTNEPKGV